MKTSQNSQEFCEVAGLSQAGLFKKRLWHRYFPLNFAKFLRTPFYRTLPVAASAKNVTEERVRH